MALGRIQRKLVWISNIGDARFNPVLTNAIKDKNLLICRYILDPICRSDKHYVSARDDNGSTLLHIAAEHGNAKIMRYLVSLKFNVDVNNTKDDYPLTIALRKSHFEIAKVLLEAGASLKCTKNYSVKMLMKIAPSPSSKPFWRYQYWDTALKIFDRADGNSQYYRSIAYLLYQARCPLYQVVNMENIDILKRVLQLGVMLDEKDLVWDRTALHWAVFNGQLDKIELLMKYGANPYQLDAALKTPLMCLYGRTTLKSSPTHELEILRILLDKIRYRMIDGLPSPAMQVRDVFVYGTKEAVRMTLKQNPNLFMVNYRDDVSLVHAVARNTKPGIASAIKGVTKSLNRRNPVTGDTALATAIKKWNYEVVELFLNEGASLQHVATFGNQTINALQLIFRMNDPLPPEGSNYKESLKIVQLILDYGGDPESRYIDGTTFFELINRINMNILARPLLAKLALKQVLRLPICELVRSQIKDNDTFQRYFNLRIQELEQAKKLIVFDSLSIVHILHAEQNDFLRYARYRGFVTRLQNVMKICRWDPYYKGVLHRRLPKLLAMAKSRDKAALQVHRIIARYYHYNENITYKILDYLTNQDISKLY